MNLKRNFSEVTIAYNQNIGLLNEARIVFQKEANDLIESAREHVLEYTRRDQDKRIKCYWGQIIDNSSLRDGPWLNFLTGFIIPFHVIRPGYTRAKKAADIYFDIRFDSDFGKYMFRCRFSNSNGVCKNLDELIIEQLEKQKPQECVNFNQIKSDIAVIFQHELDNVLIDNLNAIVDKALSLCEEVSAIRFPDSDYINAVLQPEENQECTTTCTIGQEFPSQINNDLNENRE